MRGLATVATFTAEPLEGPLKFWIAQLNLPVSVEFAPYDQVFQQLLDPNSLLSRNQDGVNVVLVRLEDSARARSKSASLEDLEEYLARNAADLIEAAKKAVTRSSTPLLVGLCPDSPDAHGSPEAARSLRDCAMDQCRADVRSRAVSGINRRF